MIDPCLIKILEKKSTKRSLRMPKADFLQIYKIVQLTLKNLFRNCLDAPELTKTKLN